MLEVVTENCIAWIYSVFTPLFIPMLNVYVLLLYFARNFLNFSFLFCQFFFFISALLIYFPIFLLGWTFYTSLFFVKIDKVKALSIQLCLPIEVYSAALKYTMFSTSSQRSNTMHTIENPNIVSLTSSCDFQELNSLVEKSSDWNPI